MLYNPLKKFGNRDAPQLSFLRQLAEMFKGAWFHLHDHVPQRDDLALQLQENGGRICYKVSRADVILVDRSRCTSRIDSASESSAKIVDYTWVEHCLRRGRRLPYTYQPSTLDTGKRKVPCSMIVDEPQDSAPAAKTSHTTKLPPSDIRVAHPSKGAVVGSGQSPSPTQLLRQPLVIPLPDTQLLSFSPAIGGRVQHPPLLREYFARFVTAVWTIDPHTGMSKLGRDVRKLLPNLSRFSLYSWYYKHKRQADDAMQHALAARRSSKIIGFGSVDDEIDRTLRSRNTGATSSLRPPVADIAMAGEITQPSRSPRKRTPRVSIPDIQRLPSEEPNSPLPMGSAEPLSTMRVGHSDVASLLEAQGQPVLPKDPSFASKIAYFDAVLKWILEREPTATRAAIGYYICARGRGRYAPRAFETAYRGMSHRHRYHEIRKSVLQRWQTGELGPLSLDDASAVSRASNLYAVGKSPKEEVRSPAIVSGGHQNRRRSLRRLAKQPVVYDHSAVGLSVEDWDEDELEESNEDDDEARSAGNTLCGLHDELELLFETGSGGSLEPETRNKVKPRLPAAAGQDVENGDRQSTEDDDESDWAIKSDEPEDRDADATSNVEPGASMTAEEIQAMTRYQMWFEGFAARINLKAETEEWDAKRAVFWWQMVHKFGRDNEFWERQYALRRREIESAVNKLRARTSYHD